MSEMRMRMTDHGRGHVTLRFFDRWLERPDEDLEMVEDRFIEAFAHLEAHAVRISAAGDHYGTELGLDAQRLVRVMRHAWSAWQSQYDEAPYRLAKRRQRDNRSFSAPVSGIGGFRPDDPGTRSELEALVQELFLAEQHLRDVLREICQQPMSMALERRRAPDARRALDYFRAEFNAL